MGRQGYDDTFGRYSNQYDGIPNMEEIVVIRNCSHIPYVEKPMYV